MKKQIRFILMLATSLVIFAGCGQDETVEETAPMVEVSVSVALSDVASRGYEDAASEGEMMNTLRIVIVRKSEDGIVEHNRLISLTEPRAWWGYETFPVYGDETKYIYFFVNEDGTQFDSNATFDFNDIKDGEAFPYSKLSQAKVVLEGIDNSQLKGQMPLPLPMNSLYSLEVGKVSMKKTFYVTRAATKFTYIIKNNSSRSYTLANLSIGNQASTEWYMQKNTTGEVPVWSTENDGILSGLTSFNTPEAGNATYHYTFYKDYANAIDIPAEGTVQLNPIYLAETKRWTDNDYRNEDDNYYTTTLSLTGLGEFTGKLGLGDKAPTGLTSDLPHQLPRNTHVVITVGINQSEVTWEVDLYPYTGVNLEPEFGL